MMSLYLFRQLPRCAQFSASFSSFFLLAAFFSVIYFNPGNLEAADSEEKTQSYPALRIGLLPDSSRELILARFEPLARYIEHTIDRPVELIIPQDYAEFLVLFDKKDVDLAFFGGYTFVKAKKLYRAEALAMRDIDLNFTSLFLTKADNAKKNLTDFKGARFSFGAKMSTSGHFMPRYFLREQGIEPEIFFSHTGYSGGHDKTAYAVRDGQADLGVANSDVIRAMFRDGRLNPTEFRILWETPFYTDYVFAVQADLPPPLKKDLLEALLDLSVEDPKQRAILSTLNAKSFIPADEKDFENLEAIIENMEKSGMATNAP